MHDVYPLTKRTEKKKYDIVGPICESADIFSTNLEMNQLEENDTLAILQTSKGILSTIKQSSNSLNFSMLESGGQFNLFDYVLA